MVSSNLVDGMFAFVRITFALAIGSMLVPLIAHSEISRLHRR
jgi:hypothetical protein